MTIPNYLHTGKRRRSMHTIKFYNIYALCSDWGLWNEVDVKVVKVVSLCIVFIWYRYKNAPLPSSTLHASEGHNNLTLCTSTRFRIQIYMISELIWGCVSRTGGLKSVKLLMVCERMPGVSSTRGKLLLLLLFPI